MFGFSNTNKNKEGLFTLKDIFEAFAMPDNGMKGIDNNSYAVSKGFELGPIFYNNALSVAVGPRHLAFTHKLDKKSGMEQLTLTLAHAGETIAERAISFQRTEDGVTKLSAIVEVELHAKQLSFTSDEELERFLSFTKSYTDMFKQRNEAFDWAQFDFDTTSVHRVENEALEDQTMDIWNSQNIARRHTLSR